jgi:antitoxin (DNA-binding transcriptional repressor) of toxin-antitoxin stability system
MINAGVKEIKNNLSRYLLQVKAGQEVVITERGKPVARIIKETKGNKSIRTALSSLIENGTVVLPSSNLNKDHLTTKEVAGKLVSEMVIEDRR